ncbi:MAG: hypothetical protein JXR67_01995 [Bacteroidales bacterium]|nr:hypothetical protein [Bacteroidales bacterium]
MDRQQIRATYQKLKQEQKLLLAELKKKHLWISLLRLLIFTAGSVLSALAFTRSVTLGSAVLISAIIVFLFLLKIFEDFTGRIAIAENLAKINGNEIRALDGDTSPFDGGSDLNDPRHDFSGDVDLFGYASLFSYLNRTVTGSGRGILAGWLLDPFELRNDIVPMQEAVKELSAKLEWRQEFMACGLGKPLDDNEIKSLREWLDCTGDSFASPFKRAVYHILPAAAISALGLLIAGVIPFSAFMLIFLINLSLVGLSLGKTNRIHALVSKKHHFLSSFEQLLSAFEKESFSSSVLLSVKEKLCSAEGSVSEKIRDLNRIIRKFDNRLNLFGGFLLNGFLLWDFHCIMRLESWRRSAEQGLPLWLSLLGRVDALNSLANHAFNNPAYIFPSIAAGEPVLEAAALGHPMLPGETRVCNDFSISGKGRVFIITGANMAGKSTFLRTVAVNMILGMTGAPVCAREMILTPVKLFTSMRTVDSLSQNESYFYAELKRLKILKEKLENGENMFFVLDEILKGTNSTDKSLGSKQFLGKLVDLGGTGMIATHDISLGEMEQVYPGKVFNLCFEIGIDGENISFDYLLREGITRKMNAAFLMKQMGIV